MDGFLRGLIVVLLNTSFYNAATRTTVSTGNWNNANTWSGNTIPSCGDSIVIGTGFTVTLANNVNFNCGSKTILVVKGNLHFTVSNKMYLPCDSRLYIFGGGEITSPGNGGANLIAICGAEQWRASDGTISGPGCLPASLPECSMVMPVELLNFTASVCNKIICLTWNTLTERNNDFFTVQKMEGDVFVDLQKIASNAVGGNSKKILTYRSNDQKPAGGVNYYRLKQTDLDGTFSYSRIIAVDFPENHSSISVFPNPNNGTFSIIAQANAQINILNYKGEIHNTGSLRPGDRYEVSGLQPGIYLCVVVSGTEKTVQRIVVN